MNPLADWAEEEIQAFRSAARRALRTRMRGLRRALPPSVIADKSFRIVERLRDLEAVQRAARIALFWPMEGQGEVDLRDFAAELLAQGRELYFPSSPEPGLRRVFELGELCERGAGYAEPPRTAPLAQELDVIVVPALAVSPEGHRLGYGAGYYDRLLLAHPTARRIVVAYDFQLVAEVPTQSWDLPAELIVTERQRLTVQ